MTAGSLTIMAILFFFCLLDKLTGEEQIVLPGACKAEVVFAYVHILIHFFFYVFLYCCSSVCSHKTAYGRKNLIDMCGFYCFTY